MTVPPVGTRMSFSEKRPMSFRPTPLVGWGGTLTGADMAFICHGFAPHRGALFILENAIVRPGV